jgi:hypothetical protein
VLRRRCKMERERGLMFYRYGKSVIGIWVSIEMRVPTCDGGVGNVGAVENNCIICCEICVQTYLGF